MNLQKRIEDDLLVALRSKDMKRLSFLRVLKGEMNRDSSVKDLTDTQVISKLRSMEENAKMLGNDFELKILSEYLPSMMGEDDTEVLVRKIIEDNGYASKKEMGLVMRAVSECDRTGTVNKSIASKIAARILS